MDCFSHVWFSVKLAIDGDSCYLKVFGVTCICYCEEVFDWAVGPEGVDSFPLVLEWRYSGRWSLMKTKNMIGPNTIPRNTSKHCA